jgi:hypothetical protein
VAGKGSPRRSWRWSVGPVAAAAVIVAVAVGVTYVVRDNGSSTSTTKKYGAASGVSATPPVSDNQLAMSGLVGRQLLQPECKPIKGPRWDYPVAPAVRGLPPPIANIKSNLYEVFAINYPCETAVTWIKKFSAMRIPIRHNGNVTVLKGPKGWYCSAFPDKNGIAYAGGCQSGGGGGCVASNNYGQLYAKGEGCKLTGGKEAFGWNWNVVNRRVVFGHTPDGKVQLFHVSGTDTNVIFSYLNGKYRLQVLNTSGIGWLDGFNWQPSAGWKVTGIKASDGATCSVTSAGKIHCAGRVKPPTCLCTGDGGIVTVTFTASPTSKKSGYLLGGSPWQFKITKMTPVPYIIPGSPDEAQKREGV